MTDLEAALRRGPATGTEGLPEVAEAAAREGLLDVAYALEDSPVGRLLVATTARGLVRVAYVDRDAGAVLERLSSRVSPRVLHAPRALDAVRRELDEYFAGARRRFDVAIDWRLASGFGRRVLEATAGVPYGGVATYAQVAQAAGSPRAVRATGNALGANPLPIVVPCHRIVRTGGGIGGYTGGLERKRALLAIEGRE